MLWNKETYKPYLLKTMFHMIHPEGVLLLAPPHIPSHPKSCPFFFSLENKQVEQTTNYKKHKTYKNLKLGTTIYKQKTDKIENCPKKAIVKKSLQK